MVARMPRYAPAASGTRSAQRIPATRQNGSPRHVLTSFDSSSSRKIEYSSGLLIRGFGVQVPGGAPGLTWGFIAPGRFFVPRFVRLVAPWLLARTDPAIRGLSKPAHGAPDARHAAWNRAPRPASCASSLLGQWSSPHSAHRDRTQSPYSGAVMQCETAGNRRWSFTHAAEVPASGARLHWARSPALSGS